MSTTHAAPDRESLRDLAVSVAAEAGELAAKGQAGITVLDTKSSPTDVVTEMDRATEELVRARLLAARPDDAFLGEEGGGEGGTSGVRWVVDPIDGTVNYLYGRSDWAVSVAAEVDGVVVAAAVNVPRLGESYEAVLGGGARLNGRVLEAPPAVPLEQALVATGFGYFPERRVQQARVLLEVIPRIRDIRRGGSAAVDLTGLAAGRCNAYYERGLHPWDWCAPGLVASEAGLRLGGARSGPPSNDLVIAARPELYGALEALLAPLGADTDG
ncbi:MULTISPECIES: inositol monophosphatase family protein [Nocardiopsis]|uniref:Inositol monophosphatase n=1 Tax=Nocardiopsis dassonvillei (strain ATCC 23218 / DSM 43111 / CIP 107115 / JCM 7437 / KCTC 9190 / NBRC 14626 / NCTC 10488 / NRRL B-5397 / IMRU 509) TaxID=446468 RepID=D7B0R3_NOCDD|nr:MULTISPECIES: inositol monophosphatase family protein [Nocardiopsis]ADH68298.1 inositol monophosphatase [Nocardiopsis dassonvillei subsp. dassonvillei DSM 43111]APC36402.1 inositol monophosphatase [Nocardiopsis dassonvillei]NKY79889.1 inositol monophosphatase [Nocardiopsis dassonvillei]VEI88801.1 Inositol-1-monophosphatase SuhB [Nocardiopsis dassonvillei]